MAYGSGPGSIIMHNAYSDDDKRPLFAPHEEGNDQIMIGRFQDDNEKPEFLGFVQNGMVTMEFPGESLSQFLFKPVPTEQS